MSALFTLPEQVPLSAGTVLPGAKLYFFQTLTTTPQNTYQDNARATPHENPVEADAAGAFPPIYLDPTLPDYRVRLTTAADVQLSQWDGVPSNQNTQQSVRLESTNPFVFLYDTDGPSNLRKYRVRSANGAFEVQAANDAENTFQTILRYEGNILYSNETEVAVTSEGDFTGTLTGVSGTITGDISYRVVNNLVTLYLGGAFAGTSTSSAMTITGLPVAIRPSIAKVVPCMLTDNTITNCAGNVTVSGSALIFGIARTDLTANIVRYGQSSFTSSGSKGLEATWTVSYPLN